MRAGGIKINIEEPKGAEEGGDREDEEFKGISQRLIEDMVRHQRDSIVKKQGPKKTDSKKSLLSPNMNNSNERPPHHYLEPVNERQRMQSIVNVDKYKNQAVDDEEEWDYEEEEFSD